MAGEGYIAKNTAGKLLFPEKSLLDIVHGHAKWAAIAMAIPLPVADWILYCFILWHMYSKLSETANSGLKIGLGILVNIGVTIAIIFADELLDWIPIFGWILSAFAVYIQFYFSGRAYISTLKELY